MNAAGQIDRAVFASGPSHLETWTAQKDETASIDESAAAMQLKGDEHMLDFKFPDLDSNTVSLRDERFKGKVVVVQIMGSWCPNCMDETAFLSRFYRENKSRGVEVIGLAYEYTLDFARASKNLRRFKDKFQVEYPMLITGVLSSDPLRTEKTLPQMTPIKAFPSMIFLGKDGTVRKTHAGYSGPATGIHHEQFIRDFNAEINSLLGGN
jgi:thiol-disulfide isomerase/thioredoxin